MTWLQLREEPSPPHPLDCVEVYPIALKWGDLAMQLRDLGITNRDIALALALAADVDVDVDADDA